MHVLVTSISRKVPLIQAVLQAAKKLDPTIRVYGGDTNPGCLGRYFVDRFWPMPDLDNMPLEHLIAYCQQEQITVIIPTRDGELVYWAKHQERLKSQGISVMVSSEATIHNCLDKVAFAQVLSAKGLPVIPTSENIDHLEASTYVVKERYGAGSQKIGLNVDKTTALEQALKMESAIFQPYITGPEYSIDVYVNAHGNLHGLIARERNVVVHGESQVTTSIRNPTLEQLVAQATEVLQLRGHAIFQVIHHLDEGQYVFVECNGRFGGASTLSLAMGLDSFYWFLLESQGKDLKDYPFQRSAVEKRQVRHLNDYVVNVHDLSV